MDLFSHHSAKDFDDDDDDDDDDGHRNDDGAPSVDLTDMNSRSLPFVMEA
jgi:hypothetical protein